MKTDKDSPTIEARAHALATALRQLRKWGLRIVRDNETSAADERGRDEQARGAACAMLGIDAAEENMRSFPARLVAQALTEPGLLVFDPALANTPFDWKNADVSPAAIAATRYGMRVVTAEQSFKDLELDQADVAFARGGSFNPVTLKNRPGGVDSLVTLLGNVAGVTLEDEQRTTLRALIDALPEHATMADLIRAVKTKEAAQLGIPLEHYDALAPLFDALLKTNND